MKQFALLLCILSFSAFASAGTVTINFETDGHGNPTYEFEPIADIYANLGVTFINGFILPCGGGCPPPAYGFFASSRDSVSLMRVDFSTLQTRVSFDDVTSSGLIAIAYDSMGNVIASLSDESGNNIDHLNLNGQGIAYVTFQWDGNIGHSGGYGIDDLTYNYAQGVPEPGSIFLLGTGLLSVAGAVRRRVA